MAKSEQKTNVHRLLEAAGIPFEALEYDAAGGAKSGVEAAEAMGLAPDEVYKTLVTRGASRANYVFVIPAPAELDLKKAAKAAGEKSIEMVRQAELLPLTGYIHGGCSPIGMKKQFPTFFEEEIILLDRVTVSAGKIGRQVRLAPDALMAYVAGEAVPLIK